MSINNDHENTDVLVMFPASKNYLPAREYTSPLDDLKDEVSGVEAGFERKKAIGTPENALSLKDITHSLEMRLKMLEDVNDRLKFYLDDLDMELIKK